MDAGITAYYDSGVEKTRLIDNFLEKVRTQAIVRRYLSRPSMTILDVGGATGAYAFWLYELGHAVHLVDPVASQIAIAQKISVNENKPLASIGVGDALELQFPDETFDLVLMLGPLYHLKDRSQRIQALSEGRRVLKKNGILVAAAVSRYASMFDGFFRDLITDPDFVAIMKDDLNSGRHENPTRHPEYFTSAYFHRPAELAAEISDSGFSLEKIVAVEGLGWLVPNLKEKWSDPKFREVLMDSIERVESEPEILGSSAHFLGVCKKSV